MKGDTQDLKKAAKALGIDFKDIIASHVAGGTLQIWLKGHRGQPIEYTPEGEAAQETRPVPPIKDERGKR